MGYTFPEDCPREDDFPLFWPDLSPKISTSIGVICQQHSDCTV